MRPPRRGQGAVSEAVETAMRGLGPTFIALGNRVLSRAVSDQPVEGDILLRKARRIRRRPRRGAVVESLDGQRRFPGARGAGSNSSTSAQSPRE